LEKSRLYYYENETFALSSRDRPQNFRPIELDGYEIQMPRADSLEISLIPIESDDDRRKWEFRCDTTGEVNYWRKAFQDSIENQQIS
jgi:hypothetical protein